MSCKNRCNCCPKCGCSETCRCTGRIMTDFSVNETSGDYIFFSFNFHVTAHNCNKCANGGIYDCGKKFHMEIVIGENCNKCANGGICDCGKKSRTVAEDTCDKCANGSTYNCGNN